MPVVFCCPGPREGTAPQGRHLVAPALAASTSSAKGGFPSRGGELNQPPEAGASAGFGASGPLFGQALESGAAPLLTGQNGGATSNAGREQKRPAA